MVLLAALTLITISSRGSGGGTLGSVRRGAHSVLSGISDGLHTALRPVGNFLAGAADYGSLKGKYDAVVRQNEALNQANARYHYMVGQLNQIAKAEKIPFAGNISTVVAPVTQLPSSNYETTITIGKGSGSGITTGEPVVTDAGLVGKVISTTSSSSVVELITDTQSVVGVSLPQSTVGTAKGQGYTSDLVVTPIPTENAAAPMAKLHQTLFTSSLGGVFPTGIPVAKVTSISGSGVAASYQVKPVVNMTNLGYVSVMRWSGQGNG